MPTHSNSNASRGFAGLALWLFGIIALFLLGSFVYTSVRIGKDVHAVGALAVREHGGETVEALIRYVEDNRHTLRERNRAVWALGQLGDRRALPVLRKHLTGETCDHHSALCQRELEKAIQLTDGGINATAFVWRRGPDR